ncbi:MAG: type IV secretion system DNA-binding domain-containing protein [Candidatus Paceibacterota bacterium]|jgi:type IV secretory pathway TraG/TraD family ATPase VirD4
MEVGKIQKIRYTPPPAELATPDNTELQNLTCLGKTNYVVAMDDRRYIFGIKRMDRTRHMYVIGKSGVGKSKLLEIMIRQDIAHGDGLCLMDPHGDVIEDVLEFIPEDRIDDVVIIDPSDTAFPASFNPLVGVEADLKHQLAQGLIEVMQKQFGANWTPRLEHVFRFTVLALLDYPYATMRGMLMMLTDRNYRQKVVEYIQHDVVKRFWAIEFADWSEKFDTDAIIPLVNKLGQFLSNPLLGNIFGQQKNLIDFEALMNSKKLIFINLSKGRLGEENSSFFGSMLITKIKQAGMARAKMSRSARQDFYLYVDEFQTVVTDTFENILSESRKYGLCLIVAHQYVAQLSPKIQQAVRGNSGTIVTFRVGGDDAESLKAEMAPLIEPKDLINLGLREFYIKMTIDGETYDPFSAETLKVLPPLHESYKDRIIAASRSKYNIPVELAEQLVREEDENLKMNKGPSNNGAGATTTATLTSSPAQAPGTGDSSPEPLI